MIEWMLTTITFILFGSAVKNIGLVPFPTAYILILGVVQVIFTFVHNGWVSYEMMSVIGRGGLQENFIKVHLLYTSISALSLFSVHGYGKKIKNINIKTSSILEVSKNNHVRTGTNIALVLVIIHVISYAIVMDWGSIWFHKRYLSTLVNSESAELFGQMAVNTVSRLVLVMSGLSAVTYCIAINSQRKIVSIISGIAALAYFCLMFSFHSRSSVIVPVIIGANILVTKPRWRLWFLPLLIAFVLASLACALEGRSHLSHGLSSIPDTIGALFSSNVSENISKVIVNIAEGSFSTAESLQITAPFSQRYKTLVFSPLPSFVDGYSKIMGTDEHRLHLFAPMSGYAETLLFGWPYFVFLLVLLYVAIRIHLRLVEVKPTLFIGCNFLFLISMHYMFAYPVRNALRFVWFAVILSLIAQVATKKNNAKPEMAAAQIKLPPRRANVMSRRAKIGIPAVNKAATKHE